MTKHFFDDEFNELAGNNDYFMSNYCSKSIC